MFLRTKQLASITVVLLLFIQGLNINAQELETVGIPEGVYKGIYIQKANGHKSKFKLNILVANGLITVIINDRRITTSFSAKAKSPGRYGELIFSLVGDSTIKVKSIPLADGKSSGLAKLVETNITTPNKFKGIYKGESDDVGEMVLNIAKDGSSILLGPAVAILTPLVFFGKIDSDGNGNFITTFDSKQFQALVKATSDSSFEVTFINGKDVSGTVSLQKLEPEEEIE